MAPNSERETIDLEITSGSLGSSLSIYNNLGCVGSLNLLTFLRNYLFPVIQQWF